MFLLTVVSVIVSLQNVQGGYDYSKPGARLELPNNKHAVGVQGFARGIFNEYKNKDEKKITYSSPYRDYNLLQKYRDGNNVHNFPISYNTVTSTFNNLNVNDNRDFKGFLPPTKLNTNVRNSITIQNSDPQRFNVNRPTTIYGYPKVGLSQSLKQHQQVPIIRNLQNSVSQGINVQQYFKSQIGVHYDQKAVLNTPQILSNVLQNQNIQPIAPLPNSQNDYASQKATQVNVNSNPSLSNQNNLAQPIQGQNTVSPVITKHIYFHAPPPDIEETTVTPTPPKKSYKIIFIKVPSQESRNIEELQAAYNKLGSTEDKTLIYVLSNNSEESSQLLVPAYKPSEHEVLFVKYNGNDSIGADGTL